MTEVSRAGGAAVRVTVRTTLVTSPVVATAVERHHGAAIERRREEGARLVAQVVVDEMPAVRRFGVAAAGEALEAASQDPKRRVELLIGPEGDFTPAELNLARSHGCRRHYDKDLTP